MSDLWPGELDAEVKRLRAEVERLRAENARLVRLHQMTMPEQVAEIERLTAALREYACTATDHPCGCYNQFLSERAEIERLTALNAALLAALRGVIEWWDADGPHRAEPDFVTEARRALEGMK